MENVKTMNFDKFIKNQVLCTECKECGKQWRKVMNMKPQWIRENIFSEKESHNTMCLTCKTGTECNEKWFEYHTTCRGCEDKVNCKGHLTKPQEEAYVENVKSDF